MRFLWRERKDEEEFNSGVTTMMNEQSVHSMLKF